MAKGNAKRKVASGDVATNRYASYRYELLDRMEAGLVLQGTEVKALRTTGAQMRDSYATLRDGEVWLHNLHIPHYAPASRDNHETDRSRKVLLHRREIDRMVGRIKERGLTLVPTRIYFANGRAKVELALARGKDTHDKREALREREQKREMDRAVRGGGRGR
jgi:SsrA-binding protein